MSDIKKDMENSLISFVPDGIYKKEKAIYLSRVLLDTAKLSGLFHEVSGSQERYGPITVFTLHLEYADKHLIKEVGDCPFCKTKIYEHEGFKKVGKDLWHEVCVSAKMKAANHYIEKHG